MSYPLDLPDALADLLPSSPSLAEAEGLLLSTDGCQKLLYGLAEAEMHGQDIVACRVIRRDVCYHMHEEFPDDVGHDWFLTLGLFEPGREGIVALGPTVVSAFPSADDPATYICNVFRCADGKLSPIEEVRDAMEGMLSPEIKEEVTAQLEVREVYHISKVGTVAGAYVVDGKVSRSNKARVIRDGIVVFTGAINALKRFKDDVKEVSTNFECGISLVNYNDLRQGDMLETFQEIEVKAKL